MLKSAYFSHNGVVFFIFFYFSFPHHLWCGFLYFFVANLYPYRSGDSLRDRCLPIPTFFISTSPIGALCALYPRGVEVTGLGCVLDTSGLILVLRHRGQVWIGHPIGHPRPSCLLFYLFFLFHTIPGMVFFIFLWPTSIPPTSGSGVCPLLLIYLFHTISVLIFHTLYSGVLLTVGY